MSTNALIEEYWRLQDQLEELPQEQYEGPQGQGLIARQWEIADQVTEAVGDERWSERGPGWRFQGRHTPGQWADWRRDDGAFFIGNDARSPVYICRMIGEQQDPEVEANAKLLMAAPDLLDASEALAAWIDREHPIWDLPDDIELCQLRQLLEEALVKARGEVSRG